jgi:hypothetical protein
VLCFTYWADHGQSALLERGNIKIIFFYESELFGPSLYQVHDPCRKSLFLRRCLSFVQAVIKLGTRRKVIFCSVNTHTNERHFRDLCLILFY